MGLFYAESYPLTNDNQNGLFATQKLTKPIIGCPNETVYNDCSFPLELTQVQKTKPYKRNIFGRKTYPHTKKADAIPVKKDLDNEYFFSKIYNLNYLNYKNANNTKIKEETPEKESISSEAVVESTINDELPPPGRDSPRVSTPEQSQTTLESPRKISLFTVLCCCGRQADESTLIHREENTNSPVPQDSSVTIDLKTASTYSLNLDESVFSLMQLKKYATRGQPRKFQQIIRTLTKNSFKNIMGVFGSS